jgi:hypothetical protein
MSDADDESRSGWFKAITSPEISMIRSVVPEFEATFQEELRAEDGEMGPFQAMSLLAEWLRRDAPDDVRRQVFVAIDRLLADNEFRFGNALAAEFYEALGDDHEFER